MGETTRNKRFAVKGGQQCVSLNQIVKGLRSLRVGDKLEISCVNKQQPEPKAKAKPKPKAKHQGKAKK